MNNDASEFQFDYGRITIADNDTKISVSVAGEPSFNWSTSQARGVGLVLCGLADRIDDRNANAAAREGITT